MGNYFEFLSDFSKFFANLLWRTIILCIYLIFTTFMDHWIRLIALPSSCWLTLLIGIHFHFTDRIRPEWARFLSCRIALTVMLSRRQGKANDIENFYSCENHHKRKLYFDDKMIKHVMVHRKLITNPGVASKKEKSKIQINDSHRRKFIQWRRDTRRHTREIVFVIVDYNPKKKQIQAEL